MMNPHPPSLVAYRRLHGIARGIWCLIAYHDLPARTPTQRSSRGAREIVRALRGLVAAGNVIDDDVRLAAYETDALTAYRQPAARGRAARDDGRGRGDSALRASRGREDRAARRGHVAVGRRDSRGRRHRRGLGQVQPDPRHRLRESLRRRAKRRDQSRDQPRRRRRRVSTTRRIRRARSRARSAATSPRTPAACIA